MMRTSRGRIARRCAISLALLAVAAWSMSTLVEGQQNASAEQIASEQYESQLQAHYSLDRHWLVSNVGELFARVR
jgi:hypothetical protein